MIGRAKVIPMPLEDFAAPRIAPAAEPMAAPPAPAPAEPRFTRDEIDAAFAAGRAAGLEEAAGSEPASVADGVARLADALALEAARHNEALEEDRRALRESLRAFLLTLCRRLAADKAAPIALSLVDRMLAASPGGSAATLFVSEATLASHGERLQSIARGASVEIDSDAELEDGECRLQWRGGAASYSNEAVAAEIDRVLAAADDAPGETP